MSSISSSLPSALPLPKRLRVESAEPRRVVWERLKPAERKLAAMLTEAGSRGRALLFAQSHRHSLVIKRCLQEAFSAKHIAATKKALGPEAFDELLLYGAKFLDQGGPYASSNRKFVLTKVPAAKVELLVKKHGAKTPAPARREIVKLLTDPVFETRQFPETPDGAGLETDGGNHYELGIRGAEVKAAVEAGLPFSLNSRVYRKKGGELAIETMTTNGKGPVAEALRDVVAALKEAHGLALSALQKEQLERTMKYFIDGKLEDFRAANVAWVRDGSKSTVDVMLGWVEVYEDWLARMGTWESYVQIVDPEVSRKAQALAKRAQSFEDAMPFGRFKKKFPPDYSPPAIMVYFLQEIASYRAGGYNLPNFDDIRRDVGAKNVIRLPPPGEDKDPELKAMWLEALTEFAPAAQVPALLAAREKVWQNVVILHEIIGHGSGTYDTTKYGEKQDPISALGSLGSALEEQRSDLAALAFIGDKRLVEAGLYESEDEAKRMRDLAFQFYLFDFMRRTSGQRTFTEAHQRGHWLLVKQLLEGGAIAWAGRDGGAPKLETQVLVVKDTAKYHDIVVKLLGELQRIKAERDDKALEALFAKDAPLGAIEEPWAKAIVARGESLLINAGYVEQPWRVTPAGAFEARGGRSLESIAPYWKEYYR